LLRQDNADLRLTELSHNLGLADNYRYELMLKKYEIINRMVSSIENSSISPECLNQYLLSLNSTPINIKRKVSDILTRPEVKLSDLYKILPSNFFLNEDENVDDIISKLINYQEIENDSIVSKIPWSERRGANEDISISEMKEEVMQSAEIQIKYKGYIEREKKLAEKLVRLENLKIPEGFDFSKVSSLSMECRIKLNRYSPKTIAQASRISGVSPADISVLLVFFGR
ncbi:MAG: hypothetical protein WCQ46_07340, partial [Bacteroidales bacterium]